MLDIHSFDFDGWIDRDVKHVFDTLLSIRLKLSVQPAGVCATEDWMVASVRITGRVLAVLNLWVSRDFAREMAVGLMGIDPSDPESKADIHDVIGVICSMIGGTLKSRLCDAGCVCGMSIPTIGAGDNFQYVGNQWEREERWSFCNCRHSVLVELFTKILACGRPFHQNAGQLVC
jgi:chemotaxis protein CheX